MQSVVLKARKAGYELIFRQAASFEAIQTELKTLLDRLQTDNIKDEPMSFDISTEDRLLSAEENQTIEQLFSKYPLFSIHKLTANVVQVADALSMRERETVHLVNETVRNGQVLSITGDVLFFGKVNEGGTLRATGNIFVMTTDILGGLEAGYPDHNQAVIVSDLATVPKVRVGELLELVDEEKKVAGINVVFIDDLQALDYQPMADLKKVRPKLFNQNGGRG